MILKASQRSGARQLAAHLLNAEENEHVEVHEVRGFMSQKLEHALEEMYAISQGTKCTQYMFSLSLSPPEDESVPVDHFEDAIHEIERKLGLDDQPRVIVFHEKKGRRHAHCVWSRIKASTMTAINMSHFKLKLQAVSKQLYLEHGWNMPPGLQCRRNSNPLNYTLAEWQQANRRGNDPKEIKAVFQACWKQSDSKKAFATALTENGYTLARGDRRGYVAIDYKGEIYSLSKWIGVNTKELKAKLGDIKNLPSVIEAQASIAKRMTQKLDGFIKEVADIKKKEAASLIKERAEMVQRHQEERKSIKQTHEIRWQEETRQRSKRLPGGLKAVWYFVTGKYQLIRKQNELETKQCLKRDREQMQSVIARQLKERRNLKQQVSRIREKQRDTLTALKTDRNRHAALTQETKNTRYPVPEPKFEGTENQKGKSGKGDKDGNAGAAAGGKFDRRSRPRGYMDSALMPIWCKTRTALTDRKPNIKQTQQRKKMETPVQATSLQASRQNIERRSRRDFIMVNRRS